MGTWGPAIFDDDFALDVKGEYEEILDSGLSHEIATATLIDRYSDALADPEESGIFWLTLASVQIEHDTLLQIVQANALTVIDSNRDLLRWEDSGEAADRKKVLEQLKVTLLKHS